MTSPSPELATNDLGREWIDSIERLIGWLAPETVGRSRVLQRLAEIRSAQAETRGLHRALRLLSQDLDALYPPGAVISLAKQRVRHFARALSCT